MITGIYKFLNTVTGKFYIGSAVDIDRRWDDHIRSLNGKYHSNIYLQASWNLHGEEAFEFIILEYCEIENLKWREQYWIDITDCCNRNVGYNLSPDATSTYGYKHSNEFKEKVRARRLGAKASDETRRKISEGNKGKIMSQEAIDKIIASKAVIGLNSDRIGMKYNKLNRVWDCPDGQKCKCQKCKTRKSDAQFYRRLKYGRKY